MQKLSLLAHFVFRKIPIFYIEDTGFFMTDCSHATLIVAMVS